MKFCLAYEGHKQHQVKYLSALAKGLRSNGLRCDLGADYTDADVCVVWGAKRVPAAYRRVLRLEAGYINGQSDDYIANRLQFISVSWGELHGRSASPVSDCPPDRWKKLKIKLKKKRTSGVTVCCLNHPGDSTAPKHEWWREYPDAIIRQHPLINPDQEPL